MEDLSGRKFGRLTAIRHDGYKEFPSSKRKVVWLCECECGNTVRVMARALKSGNTKSCGCLAIEKKRENGQKNTKHGMCNSRLYSIWHGMKYRCYNPSSHEYKNYGGKGIHICDEWLFDFKCFYEWAVCNGYRDNLTIDRIDFDKDYCPENCRWVGAKEQNNNKSNNRFIYIDGVKKSLAEWAEEHSIAPETVAYRIDKLRMSPTEALTTGVKTHPIQIQYKNASHTIQELSDIYGIPYNTLKARIRRLGWDIEKAITTPVRSCGR